jgi:hypothetical protein
VFFLISVFLFGIGMLSHPRFGRAFGLPTCMAAAAELILNIYAFRKCRVCKLNSATREGSRSTTMLDPVRHGTPKLGRTGCPA